MSFFKKSEPKTESGIKPPPISQPEVIDIPKEFGVPDIKEVDPKDIEDKFFYYTPEEEIPPTVPETPIAKRRKVLQEIEQEHLGKDPLDEDVFSNLNADMSADDLLKVCIAFYNLTNR